MKKYLVSLLAALLLLSLFSGCGAASEMPQSQDAPAVEEMQAERNDSLAAENAADTGALPAGRKWVITSDVRAETEDLDASLKTLTGRITELNGYAENQELYNGSGYGDFRSMRMTIRIPAEKIDDFLASMKENTNVVSSSKNLQDITLQYTDTETRMKALRTEEQRLLELMEKAETMADLLEIEKRLTDVRYEIENVTSRLRLYDNQVDYATVYLTLTEVKEYTPQEEPGFLQRISTGFLRSLRGVRDGFVDFLVWIIVSLPYLVLWALGITAALLLLRKCRKHRRFKKQQKEEKK